MHLPARPIKPKLPSEPEPWNEARMTVNGVDLSTGHVMTIRVALENYMSFLIETGLGDDPHGKAICEGYQRRIRELRMLMLKNR